MKIKDIKVGHQIETPRNGKGMVTHKTKRTITVTFENGNQIKATYRHNDDYFYVSDFN